jgi:hypothetical protein
MKDKKPKIYDKEVSHTLGGTGVKGVSKGEGRVEGVDAALKNITAW